MGINDFLKLPIVKIVVTLLFLYYVYYKTKDNPRSISYHINKENFSKAGEAIKLGAKQVYNEDSDINSSSENQSFGKSQIKEKLNFYEVNYGGGDKIATCGSEVEISYALISKLSQDIYNKSQIKLFIGEGFNHVMEQTIIGMKEGATRLVDIPKGFKTGDATYDKLIQNNDMIYRINLTKISDNKKEGLNCE